MPKEIVIVVAQKNFTVGDIHGNTQKILTTMADANQQGAQLCVFAELAVCGYLPKDLLWQPDFKNAVQAAMQTILDASSSFPDLTVILGFPHYVEDKIYNGLAAFQAGNYITIYHKCLLPDYGVFEEKRYFSTDNGQSAVISINKVQIGLLICEDIWQDAPLELAAMENLDLIIVINASPFSVVKFQQRLHVLNQHTRYYQRPFLYVNLIGAQDDLIFDGGACLVNAKGELTWRAEFFFEHLYTLHLTTKDKYLDMADALMVPELPELAELIYQALVLGLRDYVKKNKIKGVFIGLSGGIDSALTLAIAVDALGAQCVQAVTMPSRYTAAISIEDAQQQAQIMGVVLHEINIEPIYEQFLTTLKPLFADLPVDVTEENLQARCRGTLLMALANKHQCVVINTSNKSELAMGYGTLYGDLVGAYMVLKDVLKTWVYQLAHYRNTLSPVIPTRVLERAPTAELAPQQLDQDTLPPYEILDEIIERYVEQQQSMETIVQAGFAAEIVFAVVKKIDRNEFKRRQGAPGPKISIRALIHDRRFPITSGWEL